MQQGDYRSDRSQPGNHGGRFDSHKRNTLRNPVSKEIAPKEVPEDYVDKAEQVMRELSESVTISTSKIRNLLSLVTEIYNVENIRTEDTLLPDSISGIQMMRIRTAYECGRDRDRDQATMHFVQKAELLNFLKGIGGSREKLIRFAHYMEALVAYHRYFVEREN